jgi:hypothetical protein
LSELRSQGVVFEIVFWRVIRRVIRAVLVIAFVIVHLRFPRTIAPVICCFVVDAFPAGEDRKRTVSSVVILPMKNRGTKTVYADSKPFRGRPRLAVVSVEVTRGDPIPARRISTGFASSTAVSAESRIDREQSQNSISTTSAPDSVIRNPVAIPVPNVG